MESISDWGVEFEGVGFIITGGGGVLRKAFFKSLVLDVEQVEE